MASQSALLNSSKYMYIQLDNYYILMCNIPRTHFPTACSNCMPRTYFPRVGQESLSGWTFFPRKFCPVGQNFLGKCVPRHIFLQTDFSTTPVPIINFNIVLLLTTTISCHCSATCDYSSTL